MLLLGGIILQNSCEKRKKRGKYEIYRKKLAKTSCII